MNRLLCYLVNAGVIPLCFHGGLFGAIPHAQSTHLHGCVFSTELCRVAVHLNHSFMHVVNTTYAVCALLVCKEELGG